MSKKSFIGGINTILGEGSSKPEKPEETDKPEKKKRGRPTTVNKLITKSSQEGTKENETRATFIVREDLLDKLKNIAYWERIFLKEVINTALQEAIDKYEKKNGDIKPIPKK
jgi:hypothetical protein